MSIMCRSALSEGALFACGSSEVRQSEGPSEPADLAKGYDVRVCAALREPLDALPHTELTLADHEVRF